MNDTGMLQLSRVIQWLVIILSGFILWGCSPSPRLAPLAPNAVILAFGDSLTFGTGAAPADSYPSQLQRRLTQQVINAGVPGETTEQGLRRLPSLLQTHNPDLVILCHGGNDILRRLPYSAAKSNLQQMITMIRAQGAEVVLVGVPEFKLFSDSAPFYRELSETLQVAATLDTIGQLEKKAEYKSDHVHFNAQGYEQLAIAIETLLTDHGAIQK